MNIKRLTRIAEYLENNYLPDFYMDSYTKCILSLFPKIFPENKEWNLKVSETSIGDILHYDDIPIRIFLNPASFDYVTNFLGISKTQGLNLFVGRESGDISAKEKAREIRQMITDFTTTRKQ